MTKAKSKIKPKAQAKKIKPESFKSILNKVVKFLNDAGPESKKLWDVLTALRGPDDSCFNTKDATTAVVRHTIGLSGRTGSDLNSTYHGYAVKPDNTQYSHRRKELESGLARLLPGHFRDHILAAFNALDLKWNDVNEAK